MPHRDPETGQFVAGDGNLAVDFHDLRAGVGQVTARIPAADLSGQVSEQTATDRDRQLIDFGEIIDDDEAFELVSLLVSHGFYLSVTSSGEMSATCFGVVGKNTEMNIRTTPALDAADFDGGEDDLFDVRAQTVRNDGVLHAFTANADNGESDDTNAVGRGGSEQNGATTLIPVQALYGTGPVFDVTDALEVSYHVETDQVANVGVNLDIMAVAQGVVHEL